MKRISLILFFVSLFSFNTFAAAPKIYLNNIGQRSCSVATITNTDRNAVVHLELTNDDKTIEYINKKIEATHSPQYLLNFSRLRDGEYFIKFTLADGSEISTYFWVRDGRVAAE